MGDVGETIMAAIDDLVSNLKGGVTNLANIYQAILKVFPQQTGTASTATAGAATLPAAPAGFIVVSLPNGAIAKIPYYNT